MADPEREPVEEPPGGPPRAARGALVRPALPGDYRDGVEETDRKILSLLCQDGRISFTDLSHQTGLSVSATHQRVRRLERRGLIKRDAAGDDPAGAGPAPSPVGSLQPVRPAPPPDAPPPPGPPRP